MPIDCASFVAMFVHSNDYDMEIVLKRIMVGQMLKYINDILKKNFFL